MCATVSEAIHQCQARVAKTEIDNLLRSAEVPFIQPFWDMTPSRMQFGKLQSQFVPHARYAVLYADGRWRSVTYDDFQKLHGVPKMLRWGILDLMASGAFMAYITADGEFKGMRYFSRPLIVQSANASCTYTAVERAMPIFNRAGLQTICEKCPFAIYSMSPDASSANERMKEKMKRVIPSNCGMVSSKCAAHSAHRIIESRERDVIGNVYATNVTCSQIGHQNKLVASLWDESEDVLTNFHVGYPPAEYYEHNLQIVKHTLLRRSAFVKGSAAIDDEFDIDEYPSAKKLLVNLPGDWTKPRLEFWTCGRAISPDGARLLVYNTLIENDILQGLYNYQCASCLPLYVYHLCRMSITDICCVSMSTLYYSEARPRHCRLSIDVFRSS